MPLFRIDNNTLLPVSQRDLPTEKELQQLIEANLSSVFKCQFVATEFSTGRQHQGRIDTLALSEDNNPVIIEYKKIEASSLINQSLYYLAWIRDHHGDFELAVQKKLGSKVQVDWSAVRVICMAPSFGKFDLHAVQVMGQDIELWTYRLFNNGCLFIEEVQQRPPAGPISNDRQGKNPVMVEAGKKAALARGAAHNFEEHLEHAGAEALKELVRSFQDFIVKLDPAIEEVPKKFHIAYRTTQNIVWRVAQVTNLLQENNLEGAPFKDAQRP